MIAPLVMHPVGRRDEGIPPYASPSVPRRRSRAKLGTSQQSLERRSRAWNVARFSRVGMFLARRDVSRRPVHAKAYPIRTVRRIRSLYEFAGPSFLLIPYAAGTSGGRPLRR